MAAVTACLVTLFVALGDRFIDNQLRLSLSGKISLLLGRPEEAVSSYRELALIESENARIHAATGDLYSSLKRYSEAYPHYRRAAGIDPTLNNLIQAATTAEKVGRTDEALRWYEKVLDRDPGHDEGRRALTRLRELERAAEPRPGARAAKPQPPIEEVKPEEPAPSGTGGETSATHNEARATESPHEQRAEERNLPKSAVTRSLEACDKYVRALRGPRGQLKEDRWEEVKKRLGEPHMQCTRDDATVHCFMCSVRGRLTDTIEIIEKGGRIVKYYYGTCSCVSEPVK